MNDTRGFSAGRDRARGDRRVRMVVVDGGGLPVGEVLDAIRSGGFQLDAEYVPADEPWRMIKAWADQQTPPDLVVVIHRAGTMDGIIARIRMAEPLLRRVALVVVAAGGHQRLLDHYRELGVRHVVAGSELDRLGEVVAKALQEAPRPSRRDGPSFHYGGAGSGALRRSDILKAAAELKSDLWRIGDRIWIKDGDLRFVYVNAALARDLHMEPAEVVGLTDCDVWGPERGEKYRREDRQVLAQQRRVVTTRPETGRVIHKIPVGDGSGEHGALVLVRTWPEEERRRVEETLYTVADLAVSSTDAILIVEEDGTIRSCNPAAVAMYGHPEEELAGRSVVDIAAPGHREAQLSDLQRAAEDHQTSRREAVHLTGGDGTVDVSVTVSPVLGPWGELLGLSVVARDITEQVRARRALRASEERFRLMAETAFDGMSIVELDPETGRQTLVFCNERYVEMSGRTERSLRQTDALRAFRASREELESVEALTMLREEYLDPAYWQECDQRLARGLPVRELGSWKRPDGAENYHERSCVRVPLEGKQYLFSVDRDMTDALRREKELKETLEDMALFHTELERLGYTGERRTERTQPHRAQIEEVARRVREGPVAEFDFRAAAEQMHVSYGYFRRLFRRYMDRPPHDYLLLWRMRKAARALREPDRPVKSVAHELGYDDRVYFSKLFKSKIGLSPTDYRRALRRTQQAGP
ncbi:MAG: PAS domain-containing protein [Candidatus Brocadiia bacterium]